MRDRRDQSQQGTTEGTNENEGLKGPITMREELRETITMREKLRETITTRKK